MNAKIKAKMIWMAVVCIILSHVWLPGATAGEPTGNRYAARVRLTVIAAERISGLISSFMGIDLRNLGDVVITDSEYDWHVVATGVELKIADGKRTGVAISTVIMEPVRKDVIRSIAAVLEKEGSMPEALETLKTKQLVEVKVNWLRTDADTAIRELCRGIIADFDTQYLQPERKRYQR